MYTQQSSPIEYILGQTVNYTQTNTRILEQEIIITDNIQPINMYPFNITTDTICNIELKIVDTTITIDDTHIIANKPIFIECINDTLRIWNIKSYPNNSISSKGNTFVNGYNLLDFNNNNIKSSYTYNCTQWTLPAINLIGKIIVNGNDNNIVLNQILNHNVIVHIFGKNNLKIDSGLLLYSQLNIHITYSIIDFLYSTCDNLELKIEGNGNIKNLSVLKNAKINNIGTTHINLNKLSTTQYTETINGVGKIFWNDIIL